MLTLFYHPLYTRGIDPEARFPRDRYRLLAERLCEVPEIQLCEPRQAKRDELVTAHDPDYVDRFLSETLSDQEIRRIGLRPWTPDIIARTLHLMGGSLQALEQVLAYGGLAGNMAGGTHHAFGNYGSGYCIFNDLVICALHALHQPGIQRVLVLDLDVHQGDGTAAMLARQPAVVTCSVHGSDNFPFKKQQSDLDIALPSEAGDAEYLQAVERALRQMPFEQFDLLLYQAGVDPLKQDRLGRLAVSREGLDQRNRRVFEQAQAAGIPTVIFMGGGYSQPITHTVDAFVDLFTAAAEFSGQ
jgi:acetoin utilization deacetylase AcuC-like enzyme